MHDGVTTEVLGNCGVSPFPSAEPDGWRSAASFFEAVEKAGTAINRAFLVGLGSVRSFVMGRGSRAPAGDELGRMRDEVARALDEGVFGVSTGLIYPPGFYATREELASVAEPAGRAGALYSTHMRSEGDRIEAAIDEAEFIAARSGARLQISHLKLFNERNWRKIDWLGERLSRLCRSGVDFAADRYPYTASATDVGVIVPDWVHDGGSEARMARLRDPDVRRRVADEVLADHPEPDYWDGILVTGVAEGGNHAFNGKTLRQIGDLTGTRPVDALIGLLAEHREKAGAIFFSMSEDNLVRILSWPFVAIGSDARAQVPRGKSLANRVHPRAYGTFSRVLARYVREQKLLSLEEAVRRMTALPASRLGLRDRGVLREGALADITVFDPATVADQATYDDPHRLSTGIRHVVVNGRAVVENGVHTGALAGRVLRRTP